MMKTSERKMKRNRRCTSNNVEGKVLSLAGWFEKGISKEKNEFLSKSGAGENRQERGIEAAKMYRFGDSSKIKTLDSREVKIGLNVGLNSPNFSAQNKMKNKPIGEGDFRIGPMGEQVPYGARRTGISSLKFN